MIQAPEEQTLKLSCLCISKYEQLQQGFMFHGVKKADTFSICDCPLLSRLQNLLLAHKLYQFMFSEASMH